ncbi:nudix-type nucleoside diphosphatase (YffH/AdpP family) [Flavobacteriaceae bacterium MAR_2010_105]|nr:nudix-type nucleoside diphosphatase (YffH/AdpP family) [Flavobacteriaceae bacterium MAR_2010_105]
MANNVNVLETEVLSNNWYTLLKVTYNYLKRDNTWQTQVREAYDRGNGAAILLFNAKNKTVILTKQFRLPTFINGNNDGMMIECCAGMLDKNNPEECIKKEALEETGYRIKNVSKLFEAYMSPGAVTEILHFFVAEYDESMKLNEGGGLTQEQEDIEVVELNFEVAYDMIASGEIKDAKTIMLLQYAKIHKLLA